LPKRRELYQILKKCSIKKFPLIHLRHDLELWELDFLVNDLPSYVFNIHPLTEYQFPNYYLKYRDKIYIENSFFYSDHSISETDFSHDYAGLCLDLNHFEDSRLLFPKVCNQLLTLLEKYPLGCGHVGPIMEKTQHEPDTDLDLYESHVFTKLSEFDYLKNYPKKYFPEVIALEVENSLEEQLKAIEYLNQEGLVTIKSANV